jgi:hypothetical protein
MKYWKVIADNLSKAGWSWGCVSAMDAHGGMIWIVDAHGYGKRFVVGADEKLTAFLKLKRRLEIKFYGRGSGVGRGLDVGGILGVGDGRGVAVGLDVAVAVGVGLAVGVAVGVGEGGIGEMIQCITSLFT